MTALQTAVAFAQMQDVSIGVRQNLHFDMTRIADVFLNIYFAVAERQFRFRACRMESLQQTGVIVRDTHTASAAAG